MHVLGLPPPYFVRKINKFKNVFFCQNVVEEDLGHAFCAFQALIRTKMHVLGLYPIKFDFEKTFELDSFLIKNYGEERPKKFLFVCFRA